MLDPEVLLVMFKSSWLDYYWYWCILNPKIPKAASSLPHSLGHCSIPTSEQLWTLTTVQCICHFISVLLHLPYGPSFSTWVWVGLDLILYFVREWVHRTLTAFSNQFLSRLWSSQSGKHFIHRLIWLSEVFHTANYWMYRICRFSNVINQSIKFYLYSPYSQTTVRLIGLCNVRQNKCGNKL